MSKYFPLNGKMSQFQHLICSWCSIGNKIWVYEIYKSLCFYLCFTQHSSSFGMWVDLCYFLTYVTFLLMLLSLYVSAIKQRSCSHSTAIISSIVNSQLLQKILRWLNYNYRRGFLAVCTYMQIRKLWMGHFSMSGTLNFWTKEAMFFENIRRAYIWLMMY